MKSLEQQAMEALELHLKFLNSLPYGWLGEVEGGDINEQVGLLNDALLASRKAYEMAGKPLPVKETKE